jgi:hypothetical protein
MSDVAEANNMLRGARAISAHTGDPVRRVYHLWETGMLPAFRLGRVLCMRKTTYAQYIADLEAKASSKPDVAEAPSP